MSKTKISDFQKQIIAQAIVRVSGDVFENIEERKWAVVLVNNESGFDKNAKSPSGAVGLSQVMPQFIEEFSGHCGIKGVEKNDVFEIETNLLLGFCRFKHLLRNYGGVYSTALAAYNGGKNAKSVKELQSLARITTQETLQYIARFTHVLATAEANAKRKQNNLVELRIPYNRAIKIPAPENIN
jgi:soluble lytic murein transglycosylase-like protein